MGGSRIGDQHRVFTVVQPNPEFRHRSSGKKVVNLSKLGTLFAISGLLAMQLLAGTSQGFASNLQVPIPQRSISTPSQKLNRGDLNPHAFRRHPLKMVCLPVPPLPHRYEPLLPNSISL